ncbi:MAG TPA: cyanophycin synthetase, partial [Polyangiaceae bacterium LLY-WYZ-15_(1-7)]|nr:cyanophycin synthetase [Polyangiaceae bacterium LLY-WYZ-15_(1-7)]
AALEATLETARALRGEGGRLWLVFGCGGVRDRGKRAAMGAVAERGADEVVLTSDNPRAEDPAAIADAVEAGRGGGGARWRRELDRRAAIRAAIAGAREADVVVIAGKGHETTQELATGSRHFSDVEEARKALHSC